MVNVTGNEFDWKTFLLFRLEKIFLYREKERTYEI
jgi:hypothetical protein